MFPPLVSASSSAGAGGEVTTDSAAPCSRSTCRCLAASASAPSADGAPRLGVGLVVAVAGDHLLADYRVAAVLSGGRGQPAVGDQPGLGFGGPVAALALRAVGLGLTSVPGLESPSEFPCKQRMTDSVILS